MMCIQECVCACEREGEVVNMILMTVIVSVLTSVDQHDYSLCTFETSQLLSALTVCNVTQV